MEYGRIENGKVVEVMSEKPHWYFEDGSQVTDEWLKTKGILPVNMDPFDDRFGISINDKNDWLVFGDRIKKTFKVIHKEVVEYNPLTHKLVEKPESEWVVTDTTITITYDVVEASLEEVRKFIGSKHVVGVATNDNFIEKPESEWKVLDDFTIQKTYWEVISAPSANYPAVLYNKTAKDFSEWVKVDDTAQVMFTYEQAPVDTVKERIKKYITELRWRIETGGYKWGSHNVATDRESQSKMVGPFMLARDGIFTQNRTWKMLNGYASLTPTQIQEMCMSVHNFVQGLFDREEVLLSSVDTLNTFNELKSLYDSLNTGWDTNALYFME